MTNVTPEKVRLGYTKETTWGTNPFATTTMVPILLPVEPPDIKEEIEHILDSNARGVMARDFEGYPGMRKVTGSLTGPIYLPSTSTSDDTERSASATTLISHLGNILRVFFGATEYAALTAGEMKSHQFYAVSFTNTTPASSSLMLVVQDPVTGFTEDVAATAPVYLGCMIPKLTISYNATEGMATWSADILGIRQRFLVLDSTPDVNGVRTIDSRDRSGRASLGYGALLRVFNQSTGTVISGWDSAKLISAEITMEREIEIKVGAADQNYANIRAVRAPTITFKAVVELQQYADLQLYSNDTTASFYDAPHGWHFRLVVRDTSESSPGMPANYGAGIGTNNTDIETALNTNDGVLDILVHFADIGEGPLVIDRSAVANTLEFTGRGIYLGGRRTATYTSSPRWLTDAGPYPSTTAQAGMPVFQVRLINARTAAY